PGEQAGRDNLRQIIWRLGEGYARLRTVSWGICRGGDAGQRRTQPVRLGFRSESFRASELDRVEARGLRARSQTATTQGPGGTPTAILVCSAGSISRYGGSVILHQIARPVIETVGA